jgi:hypothetical protein
VADREYRAFVVGPDGHVVDRHDLVDVDEAEARERARQLADGHDVELWQRDKKLATFRHQPRR